MEVFVRGVKVGGCKSTLGDIQESKEETRASKETLGSVAKMYTNLGFSFYNILAFGC